MPTCKRCGYISKRPLTINTEICNDCTAVSAYIHRKREKRRQQILAAMRRYYLRNRKKKQLAALAYYHRNRKAPVI